jgi:hypothetical protein
MYIPMYLHTMSTDSQFGKQMLIVYFRTNVVVPFKQWGILVSEAYISEYIYICI